MNGGDRVVSDVLIEPADLVDELVLRVGWLVAVTSGVLHLSGLVA